MLSSKKNVNQFLRKTEFVRSHFISGGPPSLTLPFPSSASACSTDISIYASGLLNWLWQSWNHYWRTWWLIHLSGGKNKDGFPIAPIHSPRIPESLYYMLYLAGKRSKPAGMITGTYLEAMWGDPDIMAAMASRLPSLGTTVSSLLSSFGQSAKHLQVTRNSAVHPSYSSIDRFQSEVIPFYSASKSDYPTDILLSSELVTGRPAILYWLEELEAFATAAI